jgi:hypothetical protein
MASSDSFRPAPSKSRRSSFKFWVLAIAALVLIVAVQGDSSAALNKAKAKPANYSSPETTFATAQNSLAQGKYIDFIHCFSEDGLKEYAGQIHSLASTMASVTSTTKGSSAQGDLGKKIRAVIDRYVPAQRQQQVVDATDPDAQLAANLALGEAIKDRPGFVAAACKLCAQSSSSAAEFKKNLGGIKLFVASDTTLSASATTTAGFFGCAPMTIKFRVVDGNWKIDSIIDTPPEKQPLAEGETWRNRDAKVAVVDEPAAAAGGGSPGFGAMTAGGKKLDFIKPDYHGPRSDVVRVTGWATSSEYNQQSGGAIERVFVTISSLTDKPLHLHSRTQDFDFALAPTKDAGKFVLTFTAVGTRGATFETKTLAYDLSAGPPTLDLGAVDLTPSKITKFFDQPLPELPSTALWRGARPLSLAQLRGKVVLIWICAHAPSSTMPPQYADSFHGIPADLAQIYGSQGLAVIAVHTPTVEGGYRHSQRTVLPVSTAGSVVPLMIDVQGDEGFLARTGADCCSTLLVDREGKLISRLRQSDVRYYAPHIEAALNGISP